MACSYFPRRYLIIGLCFLGMLIGRALKTNLDYTMDMLPNNIGQTWEYRGDLATGLPVLAWTETMVAYLRLMYYVGFLITHLLAGYLSLFVPSHFLLGTAMTGASVFNLLLPLTIYHDLYVCTILARLLQGMFEGLLLPSYYGTLWRWTHRYERGKLGSMVISGYFLGTLLGFPLSGLIDIHCTSWYAPYVCFSAVGLLWVVFWVFIGHERPATHPSISAEELESLQEENRYDVYTMEEVDIPWKEILTSKSVLVLILCNFTYYFSYTNEPHFALAFGIHFDFYYYVLCTSVPQITLIIVAHIGGFISDAMVKSETITLTNVRKTFTCLGFSIECMCFILLCYLTDMDAILVLLIIGVGASGLTTSGWMINHLDIAPKYCGLLVGLSGTFGTLACIICSVLSDFGERWLDSSSVIMFPILAALTFSAAVCYGFFGTGEIQPWCEYKRQYSKLAISFPDQDKSPATMATTPFTYIPVQLHHKNWGSSSTSLIGNDFFTGNQVLVQSDDDGYAENEGDISYDMEWVDVDESEPLMDRIQR